MCLTDSANVFVPDPHNKKQKAALTKFKKNLEKRRKKMHEHHAFVQSRLDDMDRAIKKYDEHLTKYK